MIGAAYITAAVGAFIAAASGGAQQAGLLSSDEISNLGVIVGVLIAIAGFCVQTFFDIRRDRREQKESTWRMGIDPDRRKHQQWRRGIDPDRRRGHS